MKRKSAKANFMPFEIQLFLMTKWQSFSKNDCHLLQTIAKTPFLAFYTEGVSFEFLVTRN